MSLSIVALAMLASDPRQRWVLAGSATFAAALWVIAVFRGRLRLNWGRQQSPTVQAVNAGLGMAAGFLLAALLQPDVGGWVRFLQMVAGLVVFTAARVIVIGELRRMRTRRTSSASNSAA